MDTSVSSRGVLASPTRARLFARLEELRRPASTDELARAVDMHINGVRRHLEQLRAAGLVVRERVRRGRGRPRDEWAVASDAAPGGEPPRGYEELATWLARAIPDRRSRLREVEGVGREIGAELAPAGAPATAESFRSILASLGFQPKLEVDEGGNAHCELCNCPYRDSVRANQEVVCTLHRGMTAGLLKRVAPGSRLVGFEPHDPDLAGCVIEASGTEWGTQAASSR
jgi:predicted ArsR family transcriptional regulator